MSILFTLSCINEENKFYTYNNKSIEEISSLANNAGLPFCIVLIDSTHFTVNEYLKMIKTHTKSPHSILYNFINIYNSDNKWYSKLLSPHIYPVTCVFNTNKQLIELVPGSSIESFFYIDKAILSEETSSEFHYNQNYEKDKNDIINMVNNAIILKSKIYTDKDADICIDSLLAKRNHPYLLYLKLENQIHFNKTIEARKTANELLGFDSASDLFYYYDELLTANKVLNPMYHNSAPKISSSTNIINLPNCIIDHTYNVDIEIFNNGGHPLKISDILTSCSCVKINSSKKNIIDPGKSIILNFDFTPENKGSVYREVHIASNSLDTPIYTITHYCPIKI